MNKWTWVTLVAFVAVLGGSYYLLSQPKGKGGEQALPKADGVDMDVEDFDPQGDGDQDKDAAYDMLDDPDSGQGTPASDQTGRPHSAARRHDTTSTPEVETIDDGDDRGETVQDPVMLEDNDETVEPASTGR